MTKTWRIVAKSYAKQAFDGEGARLYGGRWNSPGVSMVYVSSSLALATLEMLVHLENSAILNQFVYIPVEFPIEFSLKVNHQHLPSDWRKETVHPSIRMIRDQWITQERSLVLEVPSVLIPEESNFLINPNHPYFSDLTIGKIEPFNFDPRLIKIPE